jgi:hypothetical protein
MGRTGVVDEDHVLADILLGHCARVCHPRRLPETWLWLLWATMWPVT